MARRSRIVVPGCAHHVTQRGNRQANVFREDEDRLHYLKLLKYHSAVYGVWVWTYTLMTNHVHTIAVPHSHTAHADTFRNAHSAYGSWFNRKYRLSGHLWQGRFYSCVLDEGHLWSAVRYVERNPVRAGMVKRAEDYRWSSARAHALGKLDPVLHDGLPLIGPVHHWSEWLAAANVENELKAIRNATARDIPLGSEEFILRLEAEMGRPLRPQKAGRKGRVVAQCKGTQGTLFADASSAERTG